MASDFIRDRTGAAPYVTPFLDALDRMQERRFVQPGRLTDRAEALQVEALGASEPRGQAAFAHGCTGLLGEHTHYFDGFALLLSLPLGTAVAIRPSNGEDSRLVFEGSRQEWAFDASQGPGRDAPAWVQVVAEVAKRLIPDGKQIDAAVVSTIPASCVDAYESALAMATARACQAVFALPHGTRQIDSVVREALIQGLNWPFGIAYVIGADHGRPDSFSLIDSATMERLALEAPSPEILGWGLVDVGTSSLRTSESEAIRQSAADEAVSILQRKGFRALESLRDLEHKDLKSALDILPSRLRPTVRHLVTENRRVQKLVGAVRRRDWQLFGALLLMSHASVQKDWNGSNEAVDAVVAEAEAMSLEGMYGACMTSRGGAVLVVGQPFIVPRCLDRIQDVLRRSLDVESAVMLL